MICPNCEQKALGFIQFLYYNPFGPCQCRSCGATLKATALTRFLCVVTLLVALGSFAYTFPVMSDFIDSQPNQTARTLLGLFLPYVVIPAQVVLFFIPTIAYTWRWGRLRLVTLPEQRGMDALCLERCEEETAAFGKNFQSGQSSRYD